jgi:peroxiredoxin
VSNCFPAIFAPNNYKFKDSDQMKKLMWILLTVIVFASCSNNANQFQITGTLDNAPEGWVMLAKVVDGNFVNFDSIQPDKGSFAFKGEIESPEIYFLVFPEGSGRVQVFTEPGKITVSGNLEEPKIEGSKTQALLDQFQTQLDKNNEERNTIYAEYQQAQSVGDTVTMSAIETRFNQIDDSEIAYILDFAKTNTSSVVTPHVMMRYSYYYELSDLEDVFSTLDPAVENSKYYKNLSETIETLRKVEIGQPAPDFTQNDTLGNPVSLMSLRGKYVLVDFWASWCGPCRAENPNVVEAYRKYNAKGFTILGVSLDRDKDKWLQAIADDQLTWMHISDLKYWDNAAAKLYGIRSIPANLLLDPNGIIVGKNLREQALQDKLAELLK